MFILDGNQLRPGVAFIHDGIKYPDNWLQLSSEEDKAAIGITWVAEEPRPDDRFYWVDGPHNDGTYTKTPKDLADLKKQWSAQFKQTAYSMLLSSDWLVVRKNEVGTAIPAEWSSYRDMVRSTCSIAIADAEAATTIDAFITAVLSVAWPISPDAPVMGAAPNTP